MFDAAFWRHDQPVSHGQFQEFCDADIAHPVLIAFEANCSWSPMVSILYKGDIMVEKCLSTSYSWPWEIFWDSW
jgi:hypothetical protein